VILGSSGTSPKTYDIFSKHLKGYTIDYVNNSTLSIDLRSGKGPTALTLSIPRQLRLGESG